MVSFESLPSWLLLRGLIVDVVIVLDVFVVLFTCWGVEFRNIAPHLVGLFDKF